jgi:peptide methionine sulfoxide reductase msrA/msrB
VERYLSLIPGVVGTRCGYANGEVPNPTYEMVCTGQSGYAEAVEVRYDSSRLGLSELLDLFYQIIDPTSVNRQGADKGPQYRTGVYVSSQDDLQIASGSLTLLSESLHKPLAVELGRLKNFYPAEDYHQRYLEKNPGGYCHIGPSHFEAASRYQGEEAESELRRRLTPMQYEVTRRGATEPPHQNEYWDHFEPGVYVDVIDGTPLFLSSHKFESGCGWPSFSRPIDQSLLATLPDNSYGRVRTEVRSSSSQSHLGHVFLDGPAASGGLRYCINSAGLRFVPKDRMREEGYGELISLVESEEAEKPK